MRRRSQQHRPALVFWNCSPLDERRACRRVALDGGVRQRDEQRRKPRPVPANPQRAPCVPLRGKRLCSSQPPCPRMRGDVRRRLCRGPNTGTDGQVGGDAAAAAGIRVRGLGRSATTATGTAASARAAASIASAAVCAVTAATVGTNVAMAAQRDAAAKWDDGLGEGRCVTEACGAAGIEAEVGGARGTRAGLGVCMPVDGAEHASAQGANVRYRPHCGSPTINAASTRRLPAMGNARRSAAAIEADIASGGGYGPRGSQVAADVDDAAGGGDDTAETPAEEVGPAAWSSATSTAPAARSNTASMSAHVGDQPDGGVGSGEWGGPDDGAEPDSC